MPSTKIINVLRDDSFEEIISIFKETPAKEVIFVLPKNCKAFKKEGDFATLSQEALNQEKSVSLLCSNPKINQLAEKYNFDVLLAKTGEEESNISTVNQYEEPAKKKYIKTKKEEDTSPPWGEYELPGEPIVEPTIAEIKVNNEELKTPEYQLVKAVKIRKMEDVISPENNQNRIKISPKKEKSFEIQIKKDTPDKPDKDNSANDTNEDMGIWSDWDKKAETKKSFKLNPKTTIAWLTLSAAVVLGTILYISSGNAKIIIKPHKEPVDYKLRVSASDKYVSLDASSNKVPGQAFNLEKSVTKTLKATGQKDAIQKARGKITIYNELGAPQPLVATTRFESEGGLVFRTLKTVTIPPAALNKPGSAEVEVIADKPGQEYNINSGKFVIVAFREKGDTERYQKIYAKSSNPMHGGINGKATVVSEADYKSAKESVTQQLTEELNNAIKTQASQLKIIDASGIVFGDPISSAEPDDAASEFSMTITGSIKTVGIKEENLYELINDYSQKNRKLKILPEKVELSYDKISLNDSGSMLEFDLVVKGNGYSDIDENQVINNLLGMNSKEIRNYFQSNENIDSAKVSFSPFWIKRMPRDKGRIGYEVEY